MFRLFTLQLAGGAGRRPTVKAVPVIVKAASSAKVFSAPPTKETASGSKPAHRRSGAKSVAPQNGILLKLEHPKIKLRREEPWPAAKKTVEAKPIHAAVKDCASEAPRVQASPPPQENSTSVSASLKKGRDDPITATAAPISKSAVSLNANAWKSVLEELQTKAAEAIANPAKAPVVGMGIRDYTGLIEFEADGLSFNVALGLLSIFQRFDVSLSLAAGRTVVAWFAAVLGDVGLQEALELARVVRTSKDPEWWTRIFPHGAVVKALLDVVERNAPLSLGILLQLDNTLKALNASAERLRLLPSAAAALAATKTAAEGIPASDFVSFVQQYGPLANATITAAVADVALAALPLVLEAMSKTSCNDRVAIDAAVAALVRRREQWDTASVSRAASYLSLLVQPLPQAFMAAMGDFVAKEKDRLTVPGVCELLEAMAMGGGGGVAMPAAGGPAADACSGPLAPHDLERLAGQPAARQQDPAVRALVAAARALGAKASAAEAVTLTRALAAIGEKEAAEAVVVRCEAGVADMTATELRIFAHAHIFLESYPEERMLRCAARFLVVMAECALDHCATVAFALSHVKAVPREVYTSISARVQIVLKFHKLDITTAHSVALLLRAFENARFLAKDDPRLFAALSERICEAKVHFTVRDACALLLVMRNIGVQHAALGAVLLGQIRQGISTLDPAGAADVLECISAAEVRDLSLCTSLAERLVVGKARCTGAQLLRVLRTLQRDRLGSVVGAARLHELAGVVALTPAEAAAFAACLLQGGHHTSAAQVATALDARQIQSLPAEASCDALFVAMRLHNNDLGHAALKLALKHQEELSGPGLGHAMLAAMQLPGLTSDERREALSALCAQSVKQQQKFDCSVVVELLTALQAHDLRVDAVFRAVGKQLSQGAGELSVPQLAAVLSVYSHFRIRDDSVVTATLMRCAELAPVVAKLPEAVAALKHAMSVFGYHMSKKDLSTKLQKIVTGEALRTKNRASAVSPAAATNQEGLGAIGRSNAVFAGQPDDKPSSPQPRPVISVMKPSTPRSVSVKAASQGMKTGGVETI